MMALALLIAGTAFGADPASEAVLLDFTATWCGPCQQMSGTISRLQRMGYPIRKVDVDREPNLAKRYGISSIPAFVLVVQGQEQGRLTGVQSEGQLKRLLQRIPQTLASAGSREGSPSQTPGVSTAAAETSAGEEKPKRGLRLPFFGQFGPGGRRQENSQPAASEGGTSTREGLTASNPAAVGVQPDVIRAKLDEPSATSDAPLHEPGDILNTIVRLRIRDGNGASFGSGTVIESLPGQTIILTCGHVFRNYDQKSMIEVDVFVGDRHERFVGKLIRYDEKADVGLVSIATSQAIPSAIVSQEPVREGQDVLSGGCSRGEAPTRQELKVTARNRYLGPDNIECTGMPVQGRSGGGLFDTAGQLVGVCIAADHKEKRGLYAGLKAVHELLDEAGLTRLYRPDAADSSHNLAETSGRDEEFVPSGSQDEMDFNTGSPAAAGLIPASVAAQVAGAEEAEVICIIRPLNNPQAASRVIIINKASGQFIRYLNGELASQPQPTSIRVPNDRLPAEGEPKAEREDVRPAILRSENPPSPERHTAHRSTSAGQRRPRPLGNRPVANRPIASSAEGAAGAEAGTGSEARSPAPTRAATAPQRYRRSAASR